MKTLNFFFFFFLKHGLYSVIRYTNSLNRAGLVGVVTPLLRCFEKRVHTGQKRSSASESCL